MPLNTAPFPIAPTPPPPKQPSALASVGWAIQVSFLTIAILMVFCYPRTQAFTSFSIIFSSIILEALPFMLLGTLIGGFVEVFIEREQLLRFLPKNRRAAIAAAAFMGIFFPVCECAIVPVVRKFIQKGLPLGSAVAFLLSGPIVNPLVFGSTLVAYAFSWETAWLRMAAGGGTAILIGIFIDAAIDENQALIRTDSDPACGCSHTCGCGRHPVSLPDKIRAAIAHGAADFYDIGRFLVMGAFIAAALQTLVSRQIFLSVEGSPLIAIAAMMVLAVVLNLCSEADAFIAASFSSTGIPLSAQMAFMVLGPMLDVKLVLMYLSVFSRRMIILLVTTICLTVFIAMTALEIARWLAV